MTARRDFDNMDRALRDRVVSAARRHASAPDAEDKAQEVILRLLQEVARPGAPVLKVRALAKLKDIEVETLRKNARTRALLDKAANEAATNTAVASSQDAYRIIELTDQLRQVVGQDGAAFALVKTFFSATEADIARYLGWSAQRAAAARMRLARNKARIAGLLVTQKEE